MKMQRRPYGDSRKEKYCLVTHKKIGTHSIEQVCCVDVTYYV